MPKGYAPALMVPKGTLYKLATPELSVTAEPTELPLRVKVIVLPLRGVPMVSAADNVTVPPYVPVAEATVM